MKKSHLSGSNNLSAFWSDSTYGSDSDGSREEMEAEGLRKKQIGYKEFSDAAHKTILIHPLCVKVIDTPQFQRLRGILQCGPSSLVYPCAVHTRFEHCLGVCYLAEKFLDNLNERVTEEERLSVMVAALCHDLGHGPFSHTWELFVNKATGIPWKHEENSVKMFNFLIEENNLRELFEVDYKLCLKFIGDLIRGKPIETGEDPDRHFLFEIVANEGTGIDVDKWEYIIRDGLQFGVPATVNVDRLIYNMKVLEVDGKRRIAFRDKAAHLIMDLFMDRARLHRTCYQHRACKLFELMYIDVLLAANESTFRIKANENGILKSYKLAECHENPTAFIQLTDQLFYLFLFEKDKMPDVYKLLNRITSRKPYSTMCLLNITQVKSTSKKVDDFIRALDKELMKIFGDSLSHLNSDTITAENAETKEIIKDPMRQSFFRYALLKLDMGKNEDPVSQVPFYDKKGNKVIIKATDLKNLYTGTINFLFEELMIFCTVQFENLPPTLPNKVNETAKTILQQFIS